MHGVHGLAGEPQCVHLATRVAGAGRGAAGAEEEEESSGRGPNGVMTNERGREVSSNTSVDAGAHCVTGRRIVIISSVISSAVYASTGASRIMRLLLEATTIGIVPFSVCLRSAIASSISHSCSAVASVRLYAP